MTEWPLQDAKNKFSALVNAALAGEPQRVTRHGQPAVVVLATEEYERLCRWRWPTLQVWVSCFFKSRRTIRNSSGCPLLPGPWTCDVSA